MTGDDAPPIDTAIEEAWVEIAEPMDYTNSFVTGAMNRRTPFIATADDRPEDEIERADTALAGVAAHALGTGMASHAYVYTTSVAAGRAVEAVFDGEGYGAAIAYVNVFRLIEDLVDWTGGPYVPFASIGCRPTSAALAVRPVRRLVAVDRRRWRQSHKVRRPLPLGPSR